MLIMLRYISANYVNNENYFNILNGKRMMEGHCSTLSSQFKLGNLDKCGRIHSTSGFQVVFLIIIIHHTLHFYNSTDELLHALLEFHPLNQQSLLCWP